jgi:DNA-directed RNA polymerase subunit RPC12/RpoP
MPIRFRCQHCGQLMGIARRKAGTEVACPKCRRQVLVPPADVEEIGARAASPPVFERSEFEAYLRDVEVGPPVPRRMQPAPAMPLPPPSPPEPVASGEPSLVPFPSSAMPGADYPDGIVLSPTWATVLTVVVILLLALSFSVGLLVGRAL